MIAVIADDFTGAAEIGGTALRYRTRIVIETGVPEGCNADMLIVASDTRAMTAPESACEIEKITRKLSALQPRFIYKKLDSVMRGNIAAELMAQIGASGKKRAIIVAGNPFFGRIIENGWYTIQSVPLAETSFAGDPDFKAVSSSVTDIIGRGGYPVVSRKPGEPLPDSGLIAGDVTCVEDLRSWAGRIDPDTVAAGGAGFFEILLGSLYPRAASSEQGEISPGNHALYVLGSNYPKETELNTRFKDAGFVRKNMPGEVYANSTDSNVFFEAWVAEVSDCLEKRMKVMVSADHPFNGDPGIAQRVREKIALLVRRVMDRVTLSDLFIEGGATTSSILRVLKISRLYPFNEIDKGIIQMRVDSFPGLVITTKPGSYPWPSTLMPQNLEPIS